MAERGDSEPGPFRMDTVLPSRRFFAIAISVAVAASFAGCGGGGGNAGQTVVKTTPPTEAQTTTPTEAQTTTPTEVDTAQVERILLARMSEIGSGEDWRVHCPSSVPVEQGKSFDCIVTGPSEWRWTITQEDAEGNRVAVRGMLTKAAAGSGFQGRIVVRGSEELRGH
jgi:hypothetical protein